MRTIHRSALLLGALVFAAGSEVRAQFRPTPPIVAPQPRELPQRAISIYDDDDNRSGPRLGVAYLFGGSVTAEREGTTLSPLMSLFGWQFERQFPVGTKGAPVLMTEVVLLAGGMEQGRFLPSASWLVGLRQSNGWEGGLGPTVTGAGVQLAFVAGRTQSFGAINVPINVAVAPGRRGASVSVTTGFNLKTRGG